MGYLLEGEWRTQQNFSNDKGRFERAESSFRNWITADGSPGPRGEGGFQAEADRYHLYISWACPWAHRALILRKLKGLEDMISLSVVNNFMGEKGWTFEAAEDVIPDTVNQADYLYEVYLKADPQYTGKVTVPVLWDKKNQTIVNNESSEIIRMFNSAFDGVGAAAGDYYPEDLRSDIDALNEEVYHKVNNGVYKAGFASTQEAYEENVVPLFATLDKLEERLETQRFLTGARITEADWRLFTTLIRFDPVYYGHFKCNLRRIQDYSNLYGYLKDLYQQPGISETVKIPAIKEHYYRSHESVNPTRIVPRGPIQDLDAPHGRETLNS